MKKSAKFVKENRKLAKRFTWSVRPERRKAASKMPLAGTCNCK